ncbi:acyl carrier protein [Streptomyces sp. YS-3]|uniref:acyl carrier protein n=1 Tax=Streptomyces sp. YS-3 TaxID=3381352 RepID=UPI00386232EC
MPTIARADVTAALAEIISEITDVPVGDIREESSFADDLGTDSLSMLEIAVAAEERFAVMIADDRVKTFTTVGDAVDHIAAHRA